MHWGENESSAKGDSETQGLSQVDQMKKDAFYFLIFKIIFIEV